MPLQLDQKKKADSKSKKKTLDEAFDDSAAILEKSDEQHIDHLLAETKQARDEIVEMRKHAVRSKRVLITTTPEIHERCKTLAAEKQISFNELINRLMENAITTKGNFI